MADPVEPPQPDPLLTAREIVNGRLLKDIPDEARRWEVATAVANQLDMAHILTTPRKHPRPGSAESPLAGTREWKEAGGTFCAECEKTGTLRPNPCRVHSEVPRG